MARRSARQQSEDSVQKQLGAFERLLHHAMSRFSKENLYHVLHHVTKWKEENQTPQHKHATKVAFKLRSISQLKQITKDMRSDRSRKSPETEMMFKNYELFLNDLLYLKDLKKYFDDEIHKTLLRYHYDANIATTDTEKSVSTKGASSKAASKGMKYMLKTGQSVKVEDEDSGHGSPAETDDKAVNPDKAARLAPLSGSSALSTASATSGTAPTPGLSGTDADVDEYRRTVSQLSQILDRWDRLMGEDVPDLNDFDPDSYHDLMQFSNYSQFETLLRLVPDIFAKCFKCIELAKAWLHKANIVLPDIPDEVPMTNNVEKQETQEDDEQTTKEIIKNIRELQSQIEDIDKKMDDDEKSLEKYNKEMDSLVAREERFTSVTSDFNKIDSLITLAAGDFQKLKTEQSAVANKLRNYPKDSPAYKEMKSHLKRLDSQVLHNHSKMKVLEFEKATIQEDYLVELEVRPEFIRFQGDTKEKIQDLERYLEIKRGEKFKLEKQLALAKTNTDRIKKIMNAFLAEEDRELLELGGDPTDNSKTAWTVKNNTSSPDGISGNEADVDSPVPRDMKSPGAAKSSRPSTSESTILQKPQIVKKGRDIRPSGEITPRDGKDKAAKSSSMKTGAGNKMPRAALKTTPRRVWENF